MRKLVASVLGLAVALSIVLHAQSKPSPSPSPAAKPDFSGTWVFDSGSDGRGGNPVGFNLGQEFTVTQDDKTISVVAATGSGGRGGLAKWTYQLDGSPSVTGYERS